MLSSDIIAHLQQNIPRYTDKFTINSDISSIDNLSYPLATVNLTSPSSIKVGSYVNICDSLTSNDIVSLTSSEGIATAVTNEAHDFTENFDMQAIISGADQPEYNGTFNIVSVPNRNTFTYSIDSSAPPVATGSIILEENLFYRTYNGFYTVTNVISPTQFQYDLTQNEPANTPISNTVVPGVAKYGHRISGGVELGSIIDSYTRQKTNDYWLFVVLGVNTASKDRNDNSDFIHTNAGSVTIRQEIIQSLTIYVTAPTINEIAGRQIRDEMQQLFVGLNLSLLNYKPDNEYMCPDQGWGIGFVSHDTADYVSPYYIHGFEYQQRADLTYDDTFQNVTRAFRDAHIDYINNNNNIIMTDEINLDEEPLP